MRSARILFVEDNKLSITITTAALEAAGHVVRSAVDGEEALAVLEEETFDLAIVDWILPGMDGLELLERVRRRPELELYVIFLTSNDRREQMVEALTAGADDYIAKPFDPEELLARVRAALRIVDLQRAVRERARDSISLVTHELQSPLASVLGYVELLVEGEGGTLTDDQQRLLEVVDRNARRLKQTIDDLLFLSSAESGVLPFESSPLDLRRLLDEQLPAFALRAQAQGVELSADLADAPLVGDELRLSQLVSNLVSNAIKFTPAGGTVAVSLVSAGDRVALAVADSGIGIPEAEQDELFGRFFRASTARDGAIPGTGLGLAISKAIVDAHGGSIAVRSTPGSGTTFAVELPAA